MTSTKTSDSLWQSLRKLRQLFHRKDKLLFLGLLGLMLGGTLLETVAIGSIPLFVSMATDSARYLQNAWLTGLWERLGVIDGRGLLLWGGGFIIAVFLVKTVYFVGLTYARIRITQQRQLNLINRLFTTYMRAPYAFHLQRNSSELMRNLQVETEKISTGVITPLLTLTMNSLLALALLALLVFKEPLMAALSFLLFGLTGGAYELGLKRKLREHGLAALEHRRRMIKTMRQGLDIAKEVRVLGREQYFIDLLHQSMMRIMQATRANNLASQMTMPYMELLAVAGLLGVSMGLVAMGRDVQQIAPTLALFAAVFIRLKSGAAAVMSSLTSLQFNTVSIDPVYQDLVVCTGSPLIDTSYTGKDRAAALSRDIEARGLSFRYESAPQGALHDINLTIRRGEAVAFVGPSGGGKTTMVDVMLGLLEPNAGQVLVDGQDIRRDIRRWQQQIGYIPQFIYLTDDTIRRNIAIGLRNEEIDEASIQRALEAAQISEFVRTLPQGLDTVVGDRGIRISGGERQRIGIARALYGNPSILFMDEATSALDSETERAIQENIDELKGQYTIVIVAHRLSTIRNVDRVVMLREGRIENIATYDELLATSPAFRRMVELQEV